MLFLPIFHLLVQPNTTLKPVLSPNISWLLLISPGVMPLNGVADLHSTIWFVLHLLSTASVASGESSLVKSIVRYKATGGVGKYWAVTFAYPPTSPQQQESWQNKSLDALFVEYLLSFSTAVLSATFRTIRKFSGSNTDTATEGPQK